MIENMTNEQAAECLKTIHVLSFKDETATFFLTDVQNAFKLAIKALEQIELNSSYNRVKTELEPCGDCISRADILDAIETWDKFGINAEQKLIKWQDHYVPYVHLDDVRHAIANMPSVTPKSEDSWKEIKIKFECDDCISRQAVIQKINNKLKLCTDMFKCLELSEIKEDVENLPSVKPTRPKGVWLKRDYWSEGVGMGETYGYYYQCSECKKMVKGGYISCDDKFCSKCGAEMRGSEE